MVFQLYKTWCATDGSKIRIEGGAHTQENTEEMRCANFKTQTPLSTGLPYPKFEPKTLGIATPKLWVQQPCGQGCRYCNKTFCRDEISPACCSAPSSLLHLKILNNLQISEFLMIFIKIRIVCAAFWEECPFYGHSALLRSTLVTVGYTNKMELLCSPLNFQRHHFIISPVNR